jgi:hypothetical protein
MGYYNHSGWGVDLNEYMHDILCCLTELSWDGLHINHHTWINDGPAHAHVVGRHSKDDCDCAWEVVIQKQGATVHLMVFRNADFYYKGTSAKPIMVYKIHDGKRECVTNRLLDVILKEV